MSHTDLPYHLYVKVDNRFLGPDMPDGTTRGIWHAVHSRPGQLLMAHVLLESGAHWSGLPLHAMSTTGSFARAPEDLMPWYAMGDSIQATRLAYLEGLPCRSRLPFEERGRHTGIIIDWSDGFSRYPEEHKPLNLISLEGGQFALLPNNFLLFGDKHFTVDEAREMIRNYRRGTRVYWEEE